MFWRHRKAGTLVDQRLSLLLLEGMQSGEPVAANAAYWNRKRQRLSAGS
jgi:hypothetical protein